MDFPGSWTTPDNQGIKYHYMFPESKLYQLLLNNMYQTNFVFLLTKPEKKIEIQNLNQNT